MERCCTHPPEPRISGRPSGTAFVGHSQYQVFAVPGAPGDCLVHIGGPSHLTGFCGIHTGWIEARVRVLPGPPPAVDGDRNGSARRPCGARAAGCR
ncbi:hypothetical protein [Actinoplanes sp. NPDC049599]|uniref:hypothetical protein n=1 Tax=Actinoplanes sp. NPDC049599 TaxID=3363903 RepID=UPI003792503F